MFSFIPNIWLHNDTMMFKSGSACQENRFFTLFFIFFIFLMVNNIIYQAPDYDQSPSTNDTPGTS